MFKRFSLPLMAFFSVGIALVSFRFVFLGVNTQAFPVMGIHIEMTKAAFTAHVAAAAIALGVGAFQFMPGLRNKRPSLHRLMGRIYGVSILVGGVAALIMAPNANGGVVSTTGFGLLSLLWIGSTAQAIRAAMARRFDLHRIWMIRSFAMTFAAVTLRLELVFLGFFGLEYNEAIQVTAWASWVLNLIIAEWWINPKLPRQPVLA